MLGILEFIKSTAATAKDAVKLYFQPLFALANLLAGSKRDSSEFSGIRRPFSVPGTQKRSE